jgi:hypothetical protein
VKGDNTTVWLKWGSGAGSEEEMKIEVDCYSGRKADERPVRFHLDGREYLVEEVLDQWFGPEDAYYKVRADDGNLYILRRETSTPEGIWHLASFREPSMTETKCALPGSSPMNASN